MDVVRVKSMLPKVKDFLQQGREVRPLEAYLRSGDTMMFDIWWNVFMVWKCRCQRLVLGMRKIVVPEKPLFTTIDLITIRGDNPCLEIYLFPKPQADAI